MMEARITSGLNGQIWSIGINRPDKLLGRAAGEHTDALVRLHQ
jgi:hypothetical protein